jgi:hypothetical protein
MNPTGVVGIIKPNRTAPGFLNTGRHIITITFSVIPQIGIGLSVKQQNKVVVGMFTGIPFSGPDISG